MLEQLVFGGGLAINGAVLLVERLELPFVMMAPSYHRLLNIRLDAAEQGSRETDVPSRWSGTITCSKKA